MSSCNGPFIGCGYSSKRDAAKAAMRFMRNGLPIYMPKILWVGEMRRYPGVFGYTFTYCFDSGWLKAESMFDQHWHYYSEEEDAWMTYKP